MKTKTIKSNTLILWGLTLTFLGGLPISADAWEARHYVVNAHGTYYKKNVINLKKLLKQQCPELDNGELRGVVLDLAQVEAYGYGRLGGNPKIALYVRDKKMQEGEINFAIPEWEPLKNKQRLRGSWEVEVTRGNVEVGRVQLTLLSKRWKKQTSNRNSCWRNGNHHRGINNHNHRNVKPAVNDVLRLFFR